ncbi:MAG TPA: multiheme c-type cytochrome, partial [Thermoanaerobaculia bacterium]|nr:multiheme c-type cytochrome [Thermoanaerobaculia bacterium]
MIRPRRARPEALAALAAAFALAAAVPPPAGAARLDPAKVVGPEACARCHDRELEVWKGTAHAKLYESDQPLHRRARAQEIARNRGVR